MAENFVNDQYEILSGKTGMDKNARKKKLKEMLKELYQLRQKVENEDTKVFLREGQIRERQEKIEAKDATISRLEGKDKKPKPKEDLDFDDDDDLEEIIVEGIIYFSDEGMDEVFDKATGKVVGEMKDGKLVFSKLGTSIHKKNVKNKGTNIKKKN